MIQGGGSINCLTGTIRSKNNVLNWIVLKVKSFGKFAKKPEEPAHLFGQFSRSFLCMD